MARSPPNCHTKVPGRSCTEGILKVTVKVKGHVIPALLSCHENRFFSGANCSITTKLAQNGPRIGLHPGCAQGQGRGQQSRNTGTFVMSHKGPRKVLYRGYSQGHGQGQRSRDTCTLSWHENRFFSAANCSITTKRALNGPRTGLHPGCAEGQGRVQRSRNTGNFVMSQKSLFLAGEWLDRPPTYHTKVPGRSCTQGIIKVTVKVKGHVILALLSCHQNRFFSGANCSITTKLAQNGPRTGLHPGCAQGQGRGQRSRNTGTFVVSQKSFFLADKWLDRHQTITQRSPEGPVHRVFSRSRSRSKVT